MKARMIVLASLVLVLGMLYFPVRFALTFELFGNAVRSPTLGWLGPTPRNAGKCVMDVGKVNSWECTDTTVFAKHRMGCRYGSGPWVTLTPNAR